MASDDLTTNGATDRETATPDPAERPRADVLTRFQRGNIAALKHGEYSTRDLAGLADFPAPFEHLRAELAEFYGTCLADEGGDSEVSARKRALLEYRARLHRRIQQLDEAIETRGLMDGRGRLRASWLQRLEGLVKAAQALDNLLGLERKPKPVANPLDYLERGADA